MPVSYTHLDVYKRQVQTCAAALAVGDLLTARYGAAWMTHPTSFRKEDE